MRGLLLLLGISALVVAAFFLGRSTMQPVPGVHTSELRGATETPAPIAIDSASPVSTPPAMPPDSGHSYHAIDLLLTRPFPDQGNLVALDVAAQPTVAYGKVVKYNTVPGKIADAAEVRGVLFSQKLGQTVCVFDVLESVFGASVPQSAGRIAVEIEPGWRVPDSSLIWDVEPEGVEDVTRADGVIMELPKVRFVRYHWGQ